MFLLNRNKSILFFVLLIIFSIPAIFSLLHFGFFQSDDGEWMIIRFSAFHQALMDGQFPVRFLSRLNYGYGYPVANFLYPGFMYLAEPIKIMGFGFTDSIKIILIFSMLGSAVFSFLWLSKLFDKWSSFIGALFYLYAPYHLFDLYKRGSVGEILALSIVPFVLWQIERKSFFWMSVGFAFLILSHNTLAVLFFPILIIYLVLSYNKLNIGHIYQYTSVLVLSLGLSSFFWVPAIFELSYTRFSETKISDIGNYFAWVDLIGLSSFIVLILSLLLVFKVRLWSRSHLASKLLILFIFLSTASIFLASSISQSLWLLLPSSFIQFPFRLLSYLILSTSFLVAYLVFVFNNMKRYLISAFLISILFISAFSFLTPPQFFDKGDPFYATNEATTTVQDEYMPRWVKTKPVNHFESKAEIVRGNGKIDNISYDSKQIMFDVNAENNLNVRVNTIYYPGWTATVDGKKVDIDYQNERGVMELAIEKGIHTVHVTFTETSLRLGADILSFFSFIVLIIFSAKLRKIQY